MNSKPPVASFLKNSKEILRGVIRHKLKHKRNALRQEGWQNKKPRPKKNQAMLFKMMTRIKTKNLQSELQCKE